MKNAYAFLTLAVLGLAIPHPATAFQEEERTANRTLTGEILYPQWLMNVPEHYEFLATPSNHDAQNQHPQQWQGQDWDPSMWNQHWTPEKAIKKFFSARIFYRQYMQDKKIPVLELGPTFYKLSDLDRRRTLKLLIDYNDLFNKGFDAVILRDWYTKETVGSYTRKGMLLN